MSVYLLSALSFFFSPFVLIYLRTYPLLVMIDWLVWFFSSTGLQICKVFIYCLLFIFLICLGSLPLILFQSFERITLCLPLAFSILRYSPWSFLRRWLFVAIEVFRETNQIYWHVVLLNSSSFLYSSCLYSCIYAREDGLFSLFKYGYPSYIPPAYYTGPWLSRK